MFAFNTATKKADTHNYSTTKGLEARLGKLKDESPESSFEIINQDLIEWEMDQDDLELWGEILS